MVGIVFINLDRAVERRRFMERQGERLGLRLERARALEPGDIEPALMQRLSGQWERPLDPAEVAAFLSHRAQWARALADDEGLLILEDDAVLSPRLPEVLARLPRDYDAITLEHFERRKFFRRKGAAVAAGPAVVRPLLRDKAGAAAYLLSPHGAARLLAIADTHAAPADAFLWGVAQLKVGQAEPALVMQADKLAARGIDPGIVVSTQIQAFRGSTMREAEGARFAARRLAAQLPLASLHLRRLLDAEFRMPAFDEDEFRRALPIRDAAAPAPPAGQPAPSAQTRS
ncbi:glycosyltransferase family 25 protein [Mangrovibrevibacter kandeliae]|uniref:glycosyltransferase family 25 protein n=1 Tax=Mangrovibrevibacter kandeliae TaxID=2968473 RepID=UPI002118FC58|nr:glycosyltransferase family 25 protein [Aurantimonas sp. CSK15Z-1]MCQ8784129.1 glycosyltransferase family 25 protein [Aurantimonas sp. CSK15Z-1]